MQPDYNAQATSDMPRLCAKNLSARAATVSREQNLITAGHKRPIEIALLHRVPLFHGGTKDIPSIEYRDRKRAVCSPVEQLVALDALDTDRIGLQLG